MIRHLSAAALDDQAGLGPAPRAWLFRDDDPQTQAVAARGPVLGEDLHDAARARAGGGAPRLLRRRVLRALLSRALDRHPASLRFEREAAGAVRLVDAPHVHLSLAGRAGWSVVAIGAGPVAVDVEADDELPPDGLRRWLVHEAAAKLTRRGLAPWPDPPSARGRHDAVFLAHPPVMACLLTPHG